MILDSGPPCILRHLGYTVVALLSLQKTRVALNRCIWLITTPRCRLCSVRNIRFARSAKLPENVSIPPLFSAVVLPSSATVAYRPPAEHDNTCRFC